MSASSLIGDGVVNAQGEDLGSIEEIMIHVPSGRVAYAVLSFGGFLGMGDKLFAVPWEALTLDEDKKQFIVDIDKETLENAPGFDKHNWPDMSAPEFGKGIFAHYGYDYKPFDRPGGIWLRASSLGIRDNALFRVGLTADPIQVKIHIKGKPTRFGLAS